MLNAAFADERLEGYSSRVITIHHYLHGLALFSLSWHSIHLISARFPLFFCFLVYCVFIFLLALLFGVVDSRFQPPNR